MADRIRTSPAKGILAFTWRAWPWFNWLIPVFICFSGWLGSGGWETLLLTMLSPLIIPAGGLLGSLPRFVLRKRGHLFTPAPLVWLLFLNGWGWIVFRAAMGGATDGAPLDSLLRSLTPGPLSRDVEGAIMLGGAVAGVLSWLVIVVLAIVLRPAAPDAHRGWTVTGWIAAFAVPALLVAAVASGVQVTRAQTDASGRTMAQAASVPLEEQRAIAEERYETLQQRLVAVRSYFAEDGWRITGYGVDRDSLGSRSTDGELYQIVIRFEHPVTDEPWDADAVDQMLAELGWESRSTLGRADADGNRLQVRDGRDGGVSIELTSASWWGDAYEIDTREYDESAHSRSYRADEWPEL